MRNEIVIQVTDSFSAGALVLHLFNDGNFRATKAIINYNVNRGLPRIEDTEHYPLTLIGKMNNVRTKIRVFSVTAGYGGTGPYVMAEILKSAGFDFDKDDICTKRYVDEFGEVSLIYFR